MNEVKKHLNNTYDTVPSVQRDYKFNNVPSIVVGDENYGEGSSREHAAMEPRFLGVLAVIVKSLQEFMKQISKNKECSLLHFAIKMITI
ncbi:MAG: hypothetical protein CM15mP13_1710 [Pseudomonadota bacterium]|nr:MAG: hypothetical protein CM15mP13_1710 [Pseudomonadota bacterium]